jgi:predicted nuclease of predicted toxin-antitoxin system
VKQFLRSLFFPPPFLAMAFLFPLPVLRIKLDENVSQGVVARIVHPRIVLTSVHSDGLAGASDSVIYAAAHTAREHVLSLDTDFLVDWWTRRIPYFGSGVIVIVSKRLAQSPENVIRQTIIDCLKVLLREHVPIEGHLIVFKAAKVPNADHYLVRRMTEPAQILLEIRDAITKLIRKIRT